MRVKIIPITTKLMGALFSNEIILLISMIKMSNSCLGLTKGLKVGDDLISHVVDTRLFSYSLRKQAAPMPKNVKKILSSN